MQELAEADALALFDRADVAHMGVVDGGDPYVTPLSFVRIDRELYFRTGPGRRLNAIRSHPRVCVEVSEYDSERGDWLSALALGEARVEADEGRQTTVVEMLLDKYRPAIGSPLAFSRAQPLPGYSLVVAVAMEQLSGMSSGLGFAPRTRPGRL